MYAISKEVWGSNVYVDAYKEAKMGLSRIT
jgi:hypothetical protein